MTQLYKIYQYGETAIAEVIILSENELDQFLTEKEKYDQIIRFEKI